MISLRLKFNSRWKRVFCLLQRNIKLYHTTLKIKTANTAYSMLFANFFFTRVAKYLKDNKCNSLSFARKHVQIFFVGHYLFLKDHSFLDLRSWKTVGILKQIVSANKYPIIFSRLIKAIVFALPSRLVTNTAWKTFKWQMFVYWDSNHKLLQKAAHKLPVSKSPLLLFIFL